MSLVSRASLVGLFVVGCATAEELPSTNTGDRAGGGSGQAGSATAPGGSSSTGGRSGSGTPAPAGSGSDGTPALAGSGGGTPAAAGSGGTGGSGGTSAAADASSGLAVDASLGPAYDDAATVTYDGPATGGLALAYQTTDAIVKFVVAITNSGAQTTPVSTLTVRYYMKTEAVPGASDVHIDYAGWTGPNPPHSLGVTPACHGVYAALGAGPDAGALQAPPPEAPDGATMGDAARLDAGPVSSEGGPRPTADSAPGTPPMPASAAPDGYLDIGCSSTQTLGPGDELTIQVRLEGSNALDDYSYAPNRGASPNPHLVLLQNGIVLSGVAP